VQKLGKRLIHSRNALTTPNVNVARNGVFDATALRSGGGIPISACKAPLRDIGVLLEKVAIAPPFGRPPLVRAEEARG
jgi:hypothetical protein